jgi:PAS domain S-box-containing protein
MTDQQTSDNHMQDRIQQIFSGQDIPAYASMQEMEAMKARIRELEQQLAGRQANGENTSMPLHETNVSLGTNQTSQKESRGKLNRIMAFLDRLSYPRKFMIISFLFLLPLLVFYPLVNEQLQRIQTYGYQEVRGADYLYALDHLLNDVQVYQIEAEKFSLGEISQGQLQASESRVDDSLQQLTQIHAHNGLTLGLGNETSQFSTEWEAIKNSVAQQQSSDLQATQLIEDIQKLIFKIGNNSYLILDPDLDTYYTIDTVLLKVPENQILLSQLLAMGNEAIHADKLTPEQSAELVVRISRLRSNLEALNTNLGFALQSDKSGQMQPLIKSALADYSISMSRFLDNVERKVITPEHISIDPGSLLADGQGLMVVQEHFFDNVSQALRIGIQGRIRTMTNRLLLGLGLVLITATFAFAIGLSVMRAISQPLQSLTAAAQRLALGDMAARAQILSGDEVGQTAAAFNTVMDRLSQTLTTLTERTRDLTLAMEVNQHLSEVRDIGTLLAEAVELIQDRFDLYYTQVYLVDTSRRNLVLRAGTGEVGIQLLNRGHRLPISPASLNGRAAAECTPVLVGNTEQSVNFLPNSLLPDTRSELAVPLIANGKVVGVLDMQSARTESFRQANLPAFQVLAGQLAIAIQNSILFEKAETSRLEVEEQARRLTTAGWQDFMNAIERSEKIGFTFNRKEVLSVKDTQTSTFDNVFAIPIEITGAKVGEIRLADEAKRTWTNAEKEVVAATASRVAQHIENLRLLAQAEQYRSEAEEVLRRLTREGWENYKHSVANEMPGYMFNLVDVQPLSANGNGHHPQTVKQPLFVRNESIGELAVDGIEDQDASEIITAVAQQLSGHIENLRLLEETQQRTLELEEAQTFLDSVIENLPHMLFVKDAENLEFLRWNRAAEELVGFPQEMMLGKNDYDFFPKEEADFFTAKDREVLASGKTLDIPEESLATANHGTRYMHTRKAPIYSVDGKPKYLLGVAEDITERKIADEVLRVSEARLSEALNIAKLANWEYDVEKDLFTFNDQFYSIFHITAEQVGGYQLSSADYARLFVYPDDMEVVGSEIGKALASTDRHYSTTLEHRILFADGGMGYVSVAIHIERDENRKIIRYYGANQDITERKKAEEVVRLAQQRAQIILESVTIPMVITRLSDNHLTFVNAPALEVTQYKYQDVINQPSPNFYVNPEDRSSFITELRAHGRISDMVVQLRGASGAGFWALMSAQVFEYQGETSILTTFMDITDRIRAEEAVAKRAAELQTVAEVSTTTATTLEPDRLLQAVVDLTKERFELYHAHIYLADDTWQTLLLAAGAGEVGRKMVADGWNIPFNHETSIVAGAARTQKSIIANDVIRDKDSIFLSNQLLPDTHSEMAVPIIVGEKLLGVFDVQSDVVGRFTEADANIYTTLAAQVGIALQNARLYVEQAATLNQLRELDKLKSSFLANMSHELRTPLNSILGFTDVIMEGLDGPLTDYMDNDLRLIQKNGQHLLHLINDVLDMAKIEAGRMNLNPENFRASEVMEEVTSITSTLASEKNLSLFLEQDTDQNVEIYADRTRLRQVMINLVNNAIKFTEKGKISLKVTPIPGARILITVKDTGIGIAPDKLEAIFQEFTQVDSSTTRKAGGTGLGLPISRRLVEMHGGRLWAESTGIPGEGSIFYVELPLEARITEVVEKQEK